LCGERIQIRGGSKTTFSLRGERIQIRGGSKLLYITAEVLFLSHQHWFSPLLTAHWQCDIKIISFGTNGNAEITVLNVYLFSNGSLISLLYQKWHSLEMAVRWQYRITMSSANASQYWQYFSRSGSLLCWR
jgi:hypothetical protein